MKHYKYLIIGNSAGGIGAMEAIRKIDKDGSMAVISDVEHHIYGRPLISYYLADEIDFDKMTEFTTIGDFVNYIESLVK